MDTRPKPPAPRPVSADVIDREIAALAHLWNRSHPDSRREFLDAAQTAGYKIVDL